MTKELPSVNTKAELTIVIPAKNESKHLPILLTSLSRQDYPLLPHTKVFVADAGSTDGTVQAALAM
ncbi:MAG: glycosyltransferase, partial [Candidatus Korobacteraceae bacterium]